MSPIATPPSVVIRVALLATGLCLGLSACSEVRRTLGYEKQPPDEFQVVQRAPLSLPPDYKLRPPTPGAVRPQERDPRDPARRAHTGRRGATPIAPLPVPGVWVVHLADDQPASLPWALTVAPGPFTGWISAVCITPQRTS